MKRIRLSLVMAAAALLALGAAADASSQATPPTNTTPPTISGTTVKGQTLTTTSGSWSGTTPMTFAYQWQRCASNGGGCSGISGATGQTYTLTSSDVGHAMRVLVTASNSAGQSSASSSATGAVADQSAPVNIAKPTISGNPAQGQTLTAGNGSWSGASSFTFRWYRCDANGNACAAVSSGQTRTLSSSDVGHRMRVEVTASNSSGSTKATSDATAVVGSSVPVLSREPFISGTARDGETLTANAGGWNNSPTKFTYRWLRCDTAGANCADVGSGVSYVLRSADVAHAMRVEVTASNSFGSTKALSNASAVVAARGQAPANSSRPTVNGTLQVGQTLAANPGAWTGTQPIAFAYQWLRCDAPARNCAVVGSGQTYTLQASDGGKVVQIVVTASNAAGNSKADSLPVGPVTTVTKLPAGGQTVDVKDVSLPQLLVVRHVQFLPSVVHSRSPFVARFQITDSRGFAVRGALVYLSVLPYGRVRQSAEVATAADGWATITLVPTRLLPLRRGASLTIFVRARKPGESLLVGVTARRLVQVRLGPPR